MFLHELDLKFWNSQEKNNVPYKNQEKITMSK